MKPIADRVIIKQDPAEETTKGGLIITDVSKEKPNKGTIVAVGPGRYGELTGTLIPMSVKVGDIVYFGKYSGTEIKIEGEEHLIMREGDLFSIDNIN